MSTLIFTTPTVRGRFRVGVTFRCDRCTEETMGEFHESEYTASAEGILRAEAERKMLAEGWEIRRGVASESNPHACDGHRCPYCRRHA